MTKTSLEAAQAADRLAQERNFFEFTLKFVTIICSARVTNLTDFRA